MEKIKVEVTRFDATGNLEQLKRLFVTQLGVGFFYWYYYYYCSASCNQSGGGEAAVMNNRCGHDRETKNAHPSFVNRPGERMRKNVKRTTHTHKKRLNIKIDAVDRSRMFDSKKILLEKVVQRDCVNNGSFVGMRFRERDHLRLEH